MTSSLSISTESLKRVDLVSVSGRVDSSNANQLDDALKGIMGNGRHNIVLELSGINYFSSAGLRSVVSTLKECKRKGGDVRLANMSERAAEVFSLAGIDTLFERFDNTTQAVGSF